MMNTIAEYIKWRGDLSFDSSPFNEVDSYIVAKIGALDLRGAVPEGGASIALADAVEIYCEKQGEQAGKLGLLASRSIFPTVKSIAETERFKGLRLTGFVSRLNESNMEQFSALSIILPDGRLYVSFRGTDDSITGWKENFMLAVEEEVHAQKDALAYLLMMSSQYEGRLVVGGHSKGGNLAIYAAAMAMKDVQDRIDSVYSFDGPGFMPGFKEKPGYAHIEDKLEIIMPQYSLVGMLLEQSSGYRIVNSNRMGPAAHDGFVWEVMGTSFVQCSDFSRTSRSFKESMDKVLNGMELEQRKEFIDEFFGTIESVGVDNLTEVTELGIRRAVTLANSLRKASKTKEFTGEVLERLLKAYAVDIAKRKKDKQDAGVLLEGPK